MKLVVVGLHGQPQADIDYLHGSWSLNGEPIATCCKYQTIKYI
jgi:euchromatic histone-lysine N-methyltransferase